MNKYIFLISSLIMPLYIQTMDKTSYTIPTTIVNHQSKVNQLCTDTASFLHSIYLLNNSPKLEAKPAHQLAQIIEQMKNLKETNPPLQEKEIGCFIYKTNFEMSMKELVLLEQPFLQRKTSKPAFAALFFARLAVYNHHLIQNSLLSPNIQQINSYLEKQEIERIVTKNRERNILIPEQTIAQITISIPQKTAIEAFINLIKDTQNIIKDSFDDIEQSVALAYHYEFK